MPRLCKYKIPSKICLIAVDITCSFKMSTHSKLFKEIPQSLVIKNRFYRYKNCLNSLNVRTEILAS